jgi:hypothetical protein
MSGSFGFPSIRRIIAAAGLSKPSQPVKIFVPRQGQIKQFVINPLKALQVSSLVAEFDKQPSKVLSEAVSFLAHEGKNNPINISREPAGGSPGALLELDLDKAYSVPLLVVGDLHGNEANLNELLTLYGEQLDRGDIGLVFLGDAIHPEDGDLTDMGSSLRLLKSIIALKQKYPDRVHYLLGNHDVIYTSEVLLDSVMSKNRPGVDCEALFNAVIADKRFAIDPDGVDRQMLLAKGGVPQAFAFLQRLIAEMKALRYSEPRIRQELKLFQSFFDGCPLALTWRGSAGNGVIAHVPWVRGGVERGQLIDARVDRKLVDQLLWNRYLDTADWQTFNEDDMIKTIERLGIWQQNDRREVTAIGGHSPEPNRVLSVYELGDGEQLPKNVRPLIVHGNVEKFHVLELMTDGRVAKDNNIHEFYQAYRKAAAA